MFDNLVATLRSHSPLIHCITNYVTVGDVANVLLACGASPVMADDAQEASEMASVAAGLCLNIGTLNSRTIGSMLLAGKAAAQRGIPILLDPVGVGATPFRTRTAMRLLKELPVAVVRGNLSEIKAIAGVGSFVKGVDAGALDVVTEENLSAMIEFCRRVARSLSCTVAVSGAIDLISDGQRTFIVRNGHPIMPRVTGTGCMLSGMTTAFLAARPEDVTEAATAAYAVMGLAGEIAHQALAPNQGTGTFRSNLIDAISLMDDATLQAGMKVELR